jgi:hypothetical protein
MAQVESKADGLKGSVQVVAAHRHKNFKKTQNVNSAARSLEIGADSCHYSVMPLHARRCCRTSTRGSPRCVTVHLSLLNHLQMFSASIRGIARAAQWSESCHHTTAATEF